MKKIIIILVSIFLLAGCQNQNESISIDGLSINIKDIKKIDVSLILTKSGPPDSKYFETFENVKDIKGIFSISKDEKIEFEEGEPEYKLGGCLLFKIYLKDSESYDFFYYVDDNESIEKLIKTVFGDKELF